MLGAIALIPSYRPYVGIVLASSFVLFSTAFDMTSVHIGTQRMFSVSVLSTVTRLASLAAIVLLVLTLAVEVIVLVGDIGRMNTVFKFYLQAWTLLSLSAAAALFWLWRAVQEAWSPALRGAWRGAHRTHARAGTRGAVAAAGYAHRDPPRRRAAQ